MMEGFIKIFRSMADWEWYSDPITKAVFIDLLIHANYKDGRFKGVEVKRGQVIFGRKETAARLGISERNVRTAMEHLKSTSEVTIKVTSRFSLVTIENYEKYQGDNFEPTSKVTIKVTSNRPATDQQVTSNRPASDHIQERKNNKKEIIQEYISERAQRLKSFP